MSVRKGVVANYVGQGWTALMSLAFVPVYIRILGIEAYGLIGVFALLQVWLSLLDTSLAPVLSREMARFTGGAASVESVRDLLRSIEWVGSGVALLIGLAIWAASGWLATDWVKVDRLTPAAVADAFALMGGVTALRCFESLYRSSVIGLQRQLRLNAVMVATATLRGLGAVAVLLWVSPTIHAFFVWQAGVSVLGAALLARVVYGSLPAARRPARFSPGALRGIGRFGLGTIAIAVTALVLTQADKLLLSRLLSLERFGVYTFAALLANALYLLVAPVTQAYSPRFAELAARGDPPAQAQALHAGAQFVSVVAGSAAAMLIFFGDPILRLWTQDHALAREVAPVLAVLAFGTLLNALIHIPYQMQLADGRTGLIVRTNLVAIACLVPALLWLTPRYGPIGAAWAWVGLNVGYLLVGTHLMFRRVLAAERWRWVGRDLLQPLLPAAATALVLRSATAGDAHPLVLLWWLPLVACLTLAAASIGAPMPRRRIAAWLRAPSAR